MCINYSPFNNKRGTIMTEPYWLNGDDVALGIQPVCDNCERQHDEDDDCDSGEPDTMWQDFFED
jgi:hypothetical protein